MFRWVNRGDLVAFRPLVLWRILRYLFILRPTVKGYTGGLWMVAALQGATFVGAGVGVLSPALRAQPATVFELWVMGLTGLALAVHLGQSLWFVIAQLAMWRFSLMTALSWLPIGLMARQTSIYLTATGLPSGVFAPCMNLGSFILVLAALGEIRLIGEAAAQKGVLARSLSKP